MNNKKMLAVFICITLVIMLFIGLFVNSNRVRKEDEPKSVSLFVYGNDSGRWENLRQGAELAANEENAEVTLITMNDEGDFEEQISLIERELERGVDGLIIAASNSERLGQYFDNKKIKIPVAFVENGIISTSDKYPCIAVDNYKMGYELGKEIIKDEAPIVKVAIVCENEERQSVIDRKNGVIDAINGEINSIVEWKRNDNEANAITRTFLQRELVSEAVDAIVVLDNSVTDSLLDALDNLSRTSKVYAISTSDRAVYCLDEGKIKALAYQAEFGMGYTGVKCLFNKKYKEEHKNEDVLYRVVKKDNMYDYDNQTLLFPFVK